MLFEHDPAGLRQFGMPWNQYDSEAEMILRRLTDVRSEDEARGMIHQVFVEQFDADWALTADHYAPLARAIWSAWQEGRLAS